LNSIKGASDNLRVAQKREAVDNRVEETGYTRD
jgi:hypothetical protein